MNTTDLRTTERLQRAFAFSNESKPAVATDASSANRRLAGHAAVIGQPTIIGEGPNSFVEVVEFGAFENCLQDDVVFLMDHKGSPMARTSSNTLTLSVDERGLRFDASIANTTAGNDLMELVRRGDVNAMSFSFSIAEESWSVIKDDGDFKGMDLRKIKKIGRLYDVSAVTFAAYPQTDVGLRSKLAAAIRSEIPSSLSTAALLLLGR